MEGRLLYESMKGGLAKQAGLYSAWEMGFGLIKAKVLHIYTSRKFFNS